MGLKTLGSGNKRSLKGFGATRAMDHHKHKEPPWKVKKQINAAGDDGARRKERIPIQFPDRVP